MGLISVKFYRNLQISILKLLQKLIEDFNFEEEYAIRCMEANRHNHITATYHLINKKN